MIAKPTVPVRHLRQLGELISKVVCEAELIHDYARLRFHSRVVLCLSNTVKLDGQPLCNSPTGRTLLASLIGRTVIDVARAGDEIVLNFRGGPTLTMSLEPRGLHSPQPLVLRRPGASSHA